MTADRCPFCGSPAEGWSSKNVLGEIRYCVGCLNEKCPVDAAVKEDNYAEAITAWNRRATPPLPAGFVAVPMPDAVDLSLIADMLDDYAISLDPVFNPESIAEQSRLLRESAEADARNVRTGTPFTPTPTPADLVARLEGLAKEWDARSERSYDEHNPALHDAYDRCADELRDALAGVKA